ncbi:RHS repeat protein [Streptomyces sp. DT2A-34]|uniref:RHS repeat domain-containing protein n=1 Tax=Streptomyces sp. DT2A-34 TaxID=3051182 RepID=UPI00265BCD60|nr:RHS repeat domain-containing protein [Streptomyces sp. DT2A-34]MDO0911753.1 RHS repeat protein [Streptomyces sp. DT2A-34]
MGTGLWATGPGADKATPETVTTYAYDASGRLRQVWDPRISPALKIAYAYDSDGRVATLTEPGEPPWTLSAPPRRTAPTTTGPARFTHHGTTPVTQGRGYGPIEGAADLGQWCALPSNLGRRAPSPKQPDE